MKKQISPKIVSLIFAVLVICFAVAFYTLAVWQGPTALPPGGNVPAPLNSSRFFQQKLGGLMLNTGGAEVGLIVAQGKVGIGTTSPAAGYKLDVEGKIQATRLDTGDIAFRSQETNQILWRMFEDEDGLYLENAKTGKVYKFVLEELSK